MNNQYQIINNHFRMESNKRCTLGPFLRAGTVSLLLMLAIGVMPVCADKIYSRNKQANKLYEQEQYDKALEIYQDALMEEPADDKLRMNKGSAHYQLQEYEKAIESYEGSLDLQDRQALADLHYNLGNAWFRKGQHALMQGMGKGVEEGKQSIKSALENYKKSLDYHSSDLDAKWNVQVAQQALKQLEELEKQHRKNQQNKDDNNKQDRNDQNKQQNKNNQNKDKQNRQKGRQDKQDKKDRQKKQQDKQQQDQDRQQQQQRQPDQDKKQAPPPKPQKQSKEDMKKKQARMLLQQYADDEDDLNKPRQEMKAKSDKPDKDW
ncbi:MAG: tetratricopeptide repeat protein [Chitinivibrionales bacterium]|nr:tetratricopeptide repeat protein [Chitinivibrionales bacterium]